MSERVKALNQKRKESSGVEEKYLLFSLAKELFGISIYKIIEIVGLMPITLIPGMPDYYKGVINLRGKVIPVVDLRLKFALGTAEYDDRTCIVIVRVDCADKSMLMGLIVDSVSEVQNIPKIDIEDLPSIGESKKKRFIQGMAKAGETIKILLDVDGVLSTEDVCVLEKISAQISNELTEGDTQNEEAISRI